MTSESNIEEVYVLRCCPPTDSQEVIKAQGAILEIPLLNVILPHKNDKQGLSVYLARQTSPRSLLQMRIDEIQSQLANAVSSIEREKLLKRLGEGTVKSMVEAEGGALSEYPLPFSFAMALISPMLTIWGISISLVHPKTSRNALLICLATAIFPLKSLFSLKKSVYSKPNLHKQASLG